MHRPSCWFWRYPGDIPEVDPGRNLMRDSKILADTNVVQAIARCSLEARAMLDRQADVRKERNPLWQDYEKRNARQAPRRGRKR